MNASASWIRLTLAGLTMIIVAVASTLWTARRVFISTPTTNASDIDSMCVSNRQIILIGDSAMARAAEGLRYLFDCQLIRQASRCDFASYYGMAVDNEQLGLEIPQGAGPTSWGKKNRGCMDCSGCHSRHWWCPIRNMTLEFLGIEFARDVEYPTWHGNSTQESIIKGYLGRNARPPYAVVFNTGLHDLPAFDVKTYAENLEWMTDLLHAMLQTRGTKLLWISTSSVQSEHQPTHWRNITTNSRIAEFNQAAAQIMKRRKIGLIDVFPLTRLPIIQNLSRDGVHYGAPVALYYRHVALSIVVGVCGDQSWNELDP